MNLHGMNHESILLKSKNYRLWQEGEFGNKLRAWRTVDEWRASGFSGLVVLRTLLPAGGGPCRYNLRPDGVEKVVSTWRSEGIPLDSIMVNEAAPDSDVILQGEYFNDIYNGPGGEVRWCHLHYSRTTTHMRDALKAAPEEAHGLRADLLLRLSMMPSSHEDWLELLVCYPGHVLEVSIYDRCLGDVPGRNAVVWEVRRY